MLGRNVQFVLLVILGEKWSVCDLVNCNFASFIFGWRPIKVSLNSAFFFQIGSTMLDFTKLAMHETGDCLTQS